ncbi:adenylate cyclase [Acrasis kona]|uniref:ATP pyrophosphate-lyase n=1 Tax=Acrasis kona TaxID=1008807 RepID=A0AAW2ZA02_9EUKA
MFPLFYLLAVLSSTYALDDIIFGQSCGLTGSLSSTSVAFTFGLNAAFNEINNNGGVFGRNVLLNTIDDGYEPSLAVANTRTLVANSSIFALVGYTGTTNSNVSLDIAKNYSYPFIGPLSGSTIFRLPFVRSCINVRASYPDEMFALVNYLVNQKNRRRISVVYQADGFGQSCLDGVISALKTISLAVRSSASYVRNTLDVEDAVRTIAASQPDAIITAGTAAAMSKFITLVRSNPLYTNPSNIIFAAPSPTDMSALVGNMSLPLPKIVMSQIVPYYNDMSLPIVREYQKSHSALDPSMPFSFSSLEGYVVGRLVTFALVQSQYGPTLNRTSFINSFYEFGAVILGSITVGPFSECNANHVLYPINKDVCGCNQGLRNVWMVEADRNATILPIDASQFKWSDSCYGYTSTNISQPIVFVTTGPSDYQGSYDLTNGVLTAFNEFNSRKGVSRMVQLYARYYDNNASCPSALDDTLNILLQDPVFYGFLAATDTRFIDSEYNVLKEYPLIASYSGSDYLSIFKSNVINVRPSFVDELSNVIRYLTNDLVMTNIGLVYDFDLRGGVVCSEVYNNIMNLFNWNAQMNYPLMGNLPENVMAVTRLLMNWKRLEAVILVLRTADSAASFVNLARPLLPRVVFVFLSFIDTAKVQQLVTSTDNILFNTFLPPSTDANSAVASAFVKSYATSASSSSSFSPTTAGLFGYIAGRLVTSTLTSMQDWKLPITRDNLINAIYSNGYYSITGYSLGPYQPSSCNMGPRTLLIYKPTSASNVSLVNTFSYSSCLYMPTSITLPIMFVMITDNYNDGYVNGINRAFDSINQQGGIRGRNVKLKLYHHGGDGNVLKQQIIDAYTFMNVTAFVGMPRAYESFYNDFSKNVSVPFIGTRSGSISMRKPYNMYMLNVRSSLMDQSAAMAKTIYVDQQLNQVMLLWQSNSSYWAEARNGFIQYALVLGKSITTEQSIAASDIVVPSSIQCVVVLGDYGVVEMIINKLSPTNANRTVHVIYDEALPSMYSIDSNIYVTFPLPTQVIDDGDYEGYLTGRLIKEGLLHLKSYSSSSFIDNIYINSVINIDGYKFGPVGLACNSMTSDSCDTSNCDCNQLSHQVNVMSAVHSYAFSFFGCGVTYPSTTNTFNLLFLLFIALFIALLVTVVIMAVVIFLWYKKKHVDVRNAPKTGNMVLAFTDVQNSTKLWNTLGQDMPKSLKVHNHVMRKLIKQYNGYEVKTQGDSFMVAFQNVKDALEWALDCQRSLVRADWPVNIVQAFDCRMEWDDCENVVFKGLRVRIGLHYGYAERVLDKVTKRYDYFGNTVNCAARVESQAKGGQVFVSQELLQEVKNDLQLIEYIEFRNMRQEKKNLLYQQQQQENGAVDQNGASSNDNDAGIADMVCDVMVDQDVEPIEMNSIQLLPNLPRSNRLCEAIVYALMGSFSLKGIKGEVNLYEVMIESLLGRSYEPKRSENNSRKSSISASPRFEQLSKYKLGANQFSNERRPSTTWNPPSDNESSCKGGGHQEQQTADRQHHVRFKSLVDQLAPLQDLEDEIENQVKVVLMESCDPDAPICVLLTCAMFVDHEDVEMNHV